MATILAGTESAGRAPGAPCYAPAHGYKKNHGHDHDGDPDRKAHRKYKKDPHYEGKSGAVYVNDCGIAAYSSENRH